MISRLRVRLEQVIDIADPGVWGSENQGGGVSVLRSTNFNNDGTLDLTKLAFRDIPERERERKQLTRGDIILERSGGGPKQPIGRVCWFPGDDRPHVFGNFCQRFRAKLDLCDSRYLFWYLYWFHATGNTLKFQKQTTGIRNLEYRYFLAHEFDLPSKSEQNRIVEIVDKADELRKKRVEADAKTARVLSALFYKIFGDPLSLVNSREGIPLSKLKVDLQNGFACGEKDVEDGVPHLRMNNIDDAGVLNLKLVRTVPLDRDTERYRLMERDVLFMGTNSEDKIGKTCLFLPPDDRVYLFSNHLIRLRVSDSRITPEYLAGLLHLLWSKKYFPSIAKRWVNQSSVAQSSLEALRIPVPSAKSLKTFTSAYRDLLSLRVHRIRSGKSINQLFSVLLHRAFAGDLTAKWREAHMKELLVEMEEQTRLLGLAS